MTQNERETLRRIAYGPDATSQERAAAEASLRQLDEREQTAAERAAAEITAAERTRAERTRGECTAAERATAEYTASAEFTAAFPLDENDVEPSLWQRSIRVGWVIPIVVGCVLVGIVGALSATGQLSSTGEIGGQTESPGPSQSPTEQASDDPNALQPPVGDLEAADHWFSVDAEPKDVFPHPGLLEATSVDPGDVRLLMSKNDDAVTVWVGRSGLGELCLLVTVGPEDHAAASCSSREDFARQGAGLGVDGFLVSWDGGDVTVDHITS